MTKLILASASPRRLDLLKQIGIVPDKIVPSDIDESLLKNESPRLYVKRLAEQKALEVYKKYSDFYVIGADTIVILGGRILPKALNNDDVKIFLKKLSGKNHQVLTAVTVVSPSGKKSSRLVLSRVGFKKLEKAEIENYVSSGEGVGKAGGYAIQGLAGVFVKKINGSYSSIVGLPLYETRNLLKGLGF